jgi:hypothetical protein
MAYDETFQQLPHFNNRELYEIPEILNGDLPGRFLEGAVKLQRVETSPVIEEWIADRMAAGTTVVPKQSYTIPTKGGEHTVAWCRVVEGNGGSGDRHQIVCDHVGELGEEALSEELLFACEGVREALMIRSYVVQDVLSSRSALADARDSYGGRRGVVRFLLDYGQKQPHNWLVSHRSDAGVVDGYAAVLDISSAKMRRTAELMVWEGDIELAGPDEQVVIPAQAA